MTENPIAQRIQALLDSKGLKRTDLSLGSGVHYDTISAWFRRAKAKPTAEDLMRVAQFLETTSDFLLHGGDAPSRVDVLRDQAGRALDLLSEKELRSLLTGIKALTASRH